MRARTWLKAVTIAIALAACADATGGSATGQGTATDEATSTPPASPATETEEAAAATGVTVAVGSGDLGDMLVDGEGRTLYLFTPDEGEQATCTEDCAEMWPPLEGDSADAGEGADEALLGTVDRPDGTPQVTYNGHPLYLFAGDDAPGDTNGQGIGDVWYVVSPGGEAVREGADSASRDDY